MSIFHDLEPEQINLLNPLLEGAQFHSGERVFDQGDCAEYLYILLSGEVSVRYKPYDGPPLTVARIVPGGVFGWSAAMMRETYTSAAVAEHDSHALRISGHQLRCLCEDHPETGVILLEHLASAIAERLRSTHTQIFNILTQGMDLNGNCIQRSGDHE